MGWLPLAKSIERAYEKCPITGCWIWKRGTNGYGYGRMWDGHKTVGAHRFMFELAYGPIPEGIMVLHKCDVRECVNPDHLFLGTCADNMVDKVAKNRQMRGSRHWASKITEAQAAAIFCDTRPQKIIAKDFGITQSQVSHIKSRDNWAHVTDTYDYRRK